MFRTLAAASTAIAFSLSAQLLLAEESQAPKCDASTGVCTDAPPQCGSRRQADMGSLTALHRRAPARSAEMAHRQTGTRGQGRYHRILADLVRRLQANDAADEHIFTSG